MFEFIKTLYSLFFYEPLLNTLVVLYKTVAFEDLGVAIVLLTILIRVILFPLFAKSVRHQTTMRELQPKLKKIQETHRSDPKRQWEETMRLHREHRINPFGGFALLLIQLPVLIALYRISLNILKPDVFGALYSFIAAPEAIRHVSLGLINLGERNIVVVVLAAIAQYVQGKMMARKAAKEEGESPQERAARQMVMVGPVITFIVFLQVPAALSLYWLTSSIFSIFQQYIVNRSLRHGESRDLYQKNG